MRPEDQRGTGQRYVVVPRVLVFLTRDEDVLLLRGAPTKRLWANKYNGLGGHVEPGETPYQAALREVREESGLRVAALTQRAVVHVTLPEPPGILFFVFVGEAPEGDPRPSLEGTPTWVSRQTMADLPLVDDLPELLPRVLEPGPLVYGLYQVTDAGMQMIFSSLSYE